MHQSQFPRSAAIVLVSCLWFSGCTAGLRQDSFRSSFLPPSTERATGRALPAPAYEPPSLSTDGPQLLTAAPREIPNYIRVVPRVPPRPQLDERIRQAEQQFLEGKKLYLEGEVEAARAAFDRAIELLLASPERAPDRALMEKKLEELVDRIHRYDVEGMGAGEEQGGVSFDKSPLEEILQLTFPIDPSLKNKVRDQLQATVSQLPLEVNDDVLRYINYFSSERGKRTLIGGLRRAGRYRPMIQSILSEVGVPQELIFLAQAESGFLPRALSHKAAAGMWQFVQWRGNEYGLKQSAYFDERLDPEKATRAGATHLRDLYHQFGDWYLAMAAYNCGPGCVSKAVERTGYADFWQLRSRNAIPRETTNYVPLILAMTIMAKNARDYGIEDADPDPEMKFDAVKMTAATSLPMAAEILDVPVAQLRELNPALLKDIAPAGYALRIPQGTTPVLVAGLNAIPAEKRSIWRTHRVQSGETSASIAKRYRTSPVNLLALHKAPGETLAAGDLVIVPSEPPPVRRVSGHSSRRAVAYRAKSAPSRKAVAAVRKPPPGRRAGAPVAMRTRLR